MQGPLSAAAASPVCALARNTLERIASSVANTYARDMLSLAVQRNRSRRTKALSRKASGSISASTVSRVAG
ncbi:hypothetical protein K458DRAFT_198044 [Lentithecium fluviatile CBS 122367]|uniref:Uncharacterized protein n=1 Tax=Lentithecium fluviatile CBS 122367 TaxID=1168545 RepID=A0A6G1J7F8_9PLEO|nr:hypothetical protein K458DRAFT_198044 [Lentithecium fluviatile CBS 122367]